MHSLGLGIQPQKPPRRTRPLAALTALLATASPAFAATADSGDTAWMLTSMALVLLMTIPGLALFYAGMVRSKNVLSVSADTSCATPAPITRSWPSGTSTLCSGSRRRMCPERVCTDAVTLA